MYNDVRVMNIAYGKPAFPAGVIYWDKLKSQCRNIQDEHDELLAAIAKGDRIEIRDALCDIMVFALGACHFLDQDISEKVAFELFTVEATCYEVEYLYGYARGIRRDYYRLVGAIEGHDLPEVHEALAEIIAGTLATSQLIGQDIFADMKMVFESNMSKFCGTEQEVAATVAKYAGVETYVDGEFPAKRVKSAKDQVVNGESYPADKMLKGVNYKKPVFA